MQEQFSDLQVDGDEGLQRSAWVYGVAFSLGFIAVLFMLLEGMRTRPGVVAHVVPMLFVLSVLCTASSLVIAKRIERARPAGALLQVVVVIGAALGAVIGFITPAVLFYSDDPYLKLEGLLFICVSCAITGIPVGASTAFLLTIYLKTPPVRLRWITAIVLWLSLGALLGVLAPLMVLMVFFLFVGLASG